MKIKHLLLGMLAMAATVACQQDQPVDEAKLEVSTEAVALEATAAEATFEVTSNQDWTATADADWVTLDPASGAGAAEAVTVKVTADDNEAAEARTATVTVTAGELTKTVALTQAGTEVVPAPEVDWTSEAVSTYELAEGVLRSIKYLVDDSYLHIKLQGSIAEINEYAALETPVDKLGLFIYDVTNGLGNGFWGWWNNAAGNNEYEGESAGKFAGTDLTLNVNGAEVPVEKAESGDAVVWTFSIPRSAHENLAAESFHFGILAYVGWDAAGAVPAKAENMFSFGVTVEPEPEPEPAPSIDWTAENVVSYDLPESASSSRQLLRNAKYFYDENNLYVRLQTTPALFAEKAPNYLGVFIYDVTNGSGDGYNGWWGEAKGNTEYEGEHVGTFSGSDLTLTIGETPVAVAKEETADELAWVLTIPRSAHANLAAENAHFAFISWNGWDPNGALPDKYGEMFQLNPTAAEPEPIVPVTEGVIWENTNGVGPTSWEPATPYRFSIEGGDSKNECIAEIPAAVWAGMKTTPFTVNITPDATKEWWQVRILDGWWTTDDGGTNDITMNTEGLVNYGDGTYAFQVDLSTKTDLLAFMDTQHLLFTGDAYTINKIYFGEPEPAPALPEPEPTAATIASVLALGNGATIPADTFVEGVVISNMDLNNLTSKKGMYIQDETAGLQFYLAANHEFKFGDKVKVDLSGAKVGAYNGAVQISGLALDKIAKVSSGNTVTPKTVTIADFLANKYEGQYVAIEGVQVASADLSKTFVMGSAHTSIKIEDADGKNFVVFSSKYATYGTTAVPQGSGTLMGISSINNGNMQLIFAQESDFAGFTGERFGQGAVEPEPETPADPEQPTTPTFASNVALGTVSSAYTDGVATVNGVANVATLKFGTSKVYGEGTITLPAGTTKVTYYAVAWKGNPSKLEFSVDGTVVATQAIAANDGATSSSPYTITVTDSDKYTVTLPTALAAETKVTVKTVETGYRAIIFGVVAE